MATDPADLYIVIAPIAASFAGFGSLAASLGRGGDDPRVDAWRLSLMLQVSLSATLLAPLPATLAALMLEESSAVRVSALVALVVMVACAPVSIRRSFRVRHGAGYSWGAATGNAACLLVGFVAFVLCALGITAERVAGLYLLGLLGLLASSVIMFSRVIISMLRPHDQRF